MAFTIIRSVVICLCSVAAGANLIHILQENRYQAQSLRRRLKLSDTQIWRRILIAVVIWAAELFVPVLTSTFLKVESVRTALCGWVVLALFTAAAVIDYLVSRDTDTETDLQLTHRLLRLIIADILILGIACTLLQLLSLSPYFLYAGASFIVPVTAWIMRPIEDFLCARYYKAARKKLEAAKHLVTVGIVGSYGKTEVKMILNTILSEKYRVLTTPPNFSTAMGIARTVNEQLTPKHRIFIAEMGAIQKGDIREMTRMVKPKYGVLTCIDLTKQSTFRSVEAAAQSMNELLARIPSNGLAIFGSDGSYSDRLYALYKGNKRNAGALSDRNCFMQARNIDMGVHGSRFELVCENGEHMWVQTALLGMYSIRNISIAAALAIEMGLTMEQIATGIAKLKPVKHHLQLRTGDLNIIDDSLNGNSESAAESLKVLAEFPGRRVLVTGGFESDEDDGYEFGTHIPGCADYVVLIGTKRTHGIVSALADCDFPGSSVKTVRTEEEAASLLKKLVAEGDTILYEGIRLQNDDE